MIVMKRQTSELETTRTSQDLVVEHFDHVELFVGNALQACHYYQRGFGFEVIGHRGLHTGVRDSASFVLKQGEIYLILTAALQPDHPAARYVEKHGDGVKCIGLRVKNARSCYEAALSKGAESIAEPYVSEDEEGRFVCASIATYGDTIHRFVERHQYTGAFAPGYRQICKKPGASDLLTTIDHIVGNVEVGAMAHWVDFYKRVFGFHVYQQFGADDISTQYSALVSTVMANENTAVKLPINEPAEGIKRSQIQEYLDYNLAPGVQHIAMGTKDIIKTVRTLRRRGIEFLSVPRAYYELLPERVGPIDEDIETLAELGILVDRESNGYLLQIFTKPVEDRPTLFFELIQRKGANGFGKGNFKALFESIEREQDLRGNL